MCRYLPGVGSTMTPQKILLNLGSVTLPAPPSPWAPASKRETQRQAKRDAVLQAAAQLFNERGFHATSLDDIAARLHVTKPTLYYYVKNKDEILIECVRQGLQMTIDGIEDSRAAGGNAGLCAHRHDGLWHVPDPRRG